MPTGDLGVLVEDHVGGAGVAADHDLVADGQLGARSLARDEDEHRQRRDLLCASYLRRGGRSAGSVALGTGSVAPGRRRHGLGRRGRP